MSDETDEIVLLGVDRSHHRSCEIVDVHEHVRAIVSSNERNERQRGELDERHERAIPLSVHDSGPQYRPAKAGRAGHRALARELRDAVHRDRMRRVVFAAGMRLGRRARRSQTRDVDKARVRRARGDGHRPRGIDVDRNVVGVPLSRDNAREMHDRIAAGKCRLEGRRCERGAHHLHAVRRRARRIRPHDRADAIASRAERGGDMPADEAGRAGHGDAAAHVRRLSRRIQSRPVAPITTARAGLAEAPPSVVAPRSLSARGAGSLRPVAVVPR